MGGGGAYMDAGADGGRRLGEEATLGGWSLAVCDRASPHLASGLGGEKGKEAWQRRRGQLILNVSDRLQTSTGVSHQHALSRVGMTTKFSLRSCVLDLPVLRSDHPRAARRGLEVTR